MLYNGVELPDINTVWTDKTTYPYATIADWSGSWGGGYWLVLCENRPVRTEDGSIKVNISVLGAYRYYQVSNNSYVLYGGNNNAYILASDENPVLWASYDVLNEDGTVYLAASDPVDPTAPTFDKKTFLSGLAMGLCGKGNPTFEASGKYLYNGVVAPAIPTELPKSGGHDFAYAAIARAKDDSSVIVFYSTTPLYVKHGGGEKYFIVSYGEWWYRLRLDNGEWADPYDGFASNPVPVTSAYGSILFSDATYDLLWSDYDIYDEDGALQFAASDPVPVENAFTKGYLVGAELRRKRKLPVAYLYNGVQLPALPEWDKEVYPYAVIYKWLTYARMYIYEQKPYITTGDNGLTYLNLSSGSKYVYKGINAINNPINGWNANEEYTAEDGQTQHTYGVIWSNFDLLNEDGTVYLAASAPVPVYE